MNSKERLLAVLQGKLPDRVPISTYGLVGWNMEAWFNHDPSYAELMNVIREKTDCLYQTGPVSTSEVPAFLTETGTDICETRTWREGESTFTEKIVQTPRGPIRNLSREDDSVKTRWILEHWLKDEDDLDRFLSIPYRPMKAETGHFAVIKERMGDHGILMVDTLDPLGYVSELFEFATFLTLVYTARDKIEHLMSIMSERLYAYFQQVVDGAGADACYRIGGPEYATPPYLPPVLLKELVVEYDKPMIRMVQKAGSYARIHSHGKISSVLDYIAEMEPDGLDPIEAPPSGDIDLAEVKSRIGDRICLFGNIQLRDLEFLSEDQIEGLVRKAMEAAAPGGRFVLTPTASPINVPLADQTKRNFIRYIEAGLEYGSYLVNGACEQGV